MSINDTTATMTAVMERLNQLGEQMRSEVRAVHTELLSGIQTVRAEIAEFRKEQQQANKETVLAIHKLEKRVDAASIEINRLQAEIRMVNERLDSLEKAPA